MELCHNLITLVCQLVDQAYYDADVAGNKKLKKK